MTILPRYSAILIVGAALGTLGCGTSLDIPADGGSRGPGDGGGDGGAVCIEGTPCDDGLAETKDDSCDAAGACVGTPYSCAAMQCEDSSVPNGVDCDTVSSAIDTPCDDGDPATSDDVCDGAGACAGMAIGCVPTQCQETSTPNGTDCDVTFKIMGSLCDDGEAATQDDICDGNGACGGTPYACMPAECEATSVPNGIDCDITLEGAGTGCDDLSASTRNDVCDGGGACAGTPYTCTPTQCELSSVPNGTDCDITFQGMGFGCDDVNLSTRNDVCDGGGSCSGTPYTCTPSQCEVTSTTNGVDCDVTYRAGGFGCDDGNNSTRNDQCNGGGVCGGTPYTCNRTLCQASSVTNGVDCTTTPMSNGSPCMDGDVCTTDTCQGGVCQSTNLMCGNGTCDTICGEHPGTCLADCGMGGGVCGPGQNSCTHWSNCQNGFFPPGDSCVGNCGGFNVAGPGTCSCDSQCVNFGDCCQDMQAVCGCP